MTSSQQRVELQRRIWQIANDVRGAVDGWDFKQYVLGTLFYRFISGNFASHIEGSDDSIRYADLPDSVITPAIKDAFFTFTQAEQQREAQALISAENLNAEAARRYITTSLKREFASDSGTELNAVLPTMSPLNPQYLSKKQACSRKSPPSWRSSRVWAV